MLNTTKRVYFGPDSLNVHLLHTIATLILIALWADLSTCVCIYASESNSKSVPNIVLILADDLGWSDVTLHGTTKFYQTPNIERLAKRGMMFTRAYRQAATLGFLMMWELSI